ncbi:hypothetical protein B9479_002902 [Cryptococcus floricola]|uniref:Extracellular membrane protein CFEM domain-containing protein n=1 Tax=Cryptococcus floricola TaxID=2591691 RepID=A0A5D3B0V5_9TREE|nr:hypothetical protein B9479_002902 [Cryptococcus floricola]
MFKPIVALIGALLCLLPFTQASAAAQFNLDVNKQASLCFQTCHSAIVGSLALEGTDTNAYQWIKQNCEYDKWQAAMTLCLPQYCTSAPDVAYAMEYAKGFCARAGVTVNIELPDSYLSGANGTYFTSEEYLDSASSAGSMPSGLLAGVVAMGVVAATFL